MHIRWYPGKREQIDAKAIQALEMTGAETLRDLKAAQTLPFREGQLTDSTTLDRSGAVKGHVAIVSATPYARRLYFHPEYNFRRGKDAEHENAGALWFEPYLKGKKNAWLKTTYRKFLKGLM